MLKTISLLGVNVSRVDPVLAVQEIFEWVTQKKRAYVCVAPAATLVDARRDPLYAAAVNAAGMVTPDGMPVVWLAQARGCKDIEVGVEAFFLRRYRGYFAEIGAES
jgi:N-acetylglucosaminyldiphosphoundecaprenol N-acetyl-beta-D-mannosaminyltransferase